MKTHILSHNQVVKMIRRMAYQVYEQNSSSKELIIASIQGKGEVLGEKIAAELREISGMKITEMRIDVDKSKLDSLTLIHSEAKLNLKNKTVLLVDDVLNTGRTTLFCMTPFIEAKVSGISVCVLVDRDHKVFPVSADIIGIKLSTTLQEHVVVDLNRKGEFEVYLK